MTTTSGDIVRAGRRDYVLMAAVLVAVMAGGTLPIPLYVLYERQMGFGPLGVTVVFAVYVVGTLAALLAFGDLSDHVGRRKLLAVAVACAMISTGLFLVTSGVGLLIVARVISGLASGFATGTATAALAELQPHGDRRAAAVIASGANMAGLGLGPLVAGVFAAYVAAPTRAVFWAYLGVCVLALAALAVIAETVHEPDGIIRVRAGLGVPPGMRAVMAGACLGIFAAFSILGTFSSLVPTFLHGILAVRNLALIGAASFLIFIIAAISQALSARLPARRSVTAGLPLLLICLAALEAALFAQALWLFLAGTVIGGIAVGLIFRGSLSELNRLAGARDRAGVVSTFFAAAYLGLGIPAVLTGLISQLISTVDASVYTSGLVAAIVLAAIVVVLRTFGVAPAPKPVGVRPTRRGKQKEGIVMTEANGNDARTTVAVIGAGIMGSAMTRNLVAAGMNTRVWDGSPAATAPLAAAGAVAAPSARMAVQDADVVITMLPTAGAVESVIFDGGVADAFTDGCVWAQMGTIGVEATRRIRDRLAAQRPGVVFVDSPVSGSKGPAEHGQLLILASGPAAAADRVNPVFDILGRKTVWLGEVGQGSLVKLVVNTYMSILIEGVAETMELADRLGIGHQQLAEAIEGGPLDAPIADAKLHKMDRGDFTAEFPLEWALKDVDLAISAAGDQTPPLLAALSRQWHDAVAAGHGRQDISAARLALPVRG